MSKKSPCLRPIGVCIQFSVSFFGRHVLLLNFKIIHCKEINYLEVHLITKYLFTCFSLIKVIRFFPQFKVFFLKVMGTLTFDFSLDVFRWNLFLWNLFLVYQKRTCNNIKTYFTWILQTTCRSLYPKQIGKGRWHSFLENKVHYLEVLHL